jgi:hypothetical protein
VTGSLLRVRWATGEESTFVPSMGSLAVVGKQSDSVGQARRARESGRGRGDAEADVMADDIAEQRRKLAAAVRVAHAKYAAVAIKMPSKRGGRANEEDVPSSVELRWRPGDVQAASSLL